jgi:hypothetical protein
VSGAEGAHRRARPTSWPAEPRADARFRHPPLRCCTICSMLIWNQPLRQFSSLDCCMAPRKLALRVHGGAAVDLQTPGFCHRCDNANPR